MLKAKSFGETMQDFKKLSVWQKSHLLAIAVYQATSNFPKTEVYGLTSQMRSSCISIPTNIAEGCGRQSDADFGHFLQIALGSTHELQHYFLLSRDLKLFDDSNYMSLDNQVNEIKRMLIALIKATRDVKKAL
jgi:four helix bundle protein